MAKNKLKKFADNETFQNLIQEPRADLLKNGLSLKGKWRQSYFKNENPIVLELGCGKGEYSIALGEKFPEKNFIGVDIKGARMWRGAKTATDNSMGNVAFLRTHIEQLDRCFDKGEVSELWITFPDPQIKYRRRKKRLTSPFMFELYQKVLSKDATLHLKTDSEFLYGYTMGIIEGYGHQLLDSSYDIDHQKPDDHLLKVRTHYEELFRKEGKPITYLKFQLKDV